MAAAGEQKNVSKMWEMAAQDLVARSTVERVILAIFNEIPGKCHFLPSQPVALFSNVKEDEMRLGGPVKTRRVTDEGQMMQNAATTDAMDGCSCSDCESKSLTPSVAWEMILAPSVHR